MSTEADSGTVESFLKNNPRLMGAVFVTLLLLSGAGNAAAGGVGCVVGP